MNADENSGCVHAPNTERAVAAGLQQMAALQLRNTIAIWLGLGVLGLIVVAGCFPLARLFLTFWSSL